MSDWGMLEWIGAIAGGASVIGTIFGGYALFRRPKTEATKASASGKNSRLAQVTNSPNSMIVMDSPSALVIQRDLIVNPGYAVHEHERIMKERVAEVRANMERAHQAEVDALRAQIAALKEPEWDKDTIEAVQAALNTNQFDRAEELMARMEESHLAAASIPATQKQVRIRQLRAAIALVNGDARTASEHLEVAAGIIAPLDPEGAPGFRNAAAMHLQDYGERVGGGAIVEAIRLYRINLEQLNRETHPEEWAETQHNLGNALLLQGMRAEGALQLLAEAIEAFRAALQVCTREACPGDWAETQISLGAALMVFGEHGGGEEGADYLAEAVRVLRAAAQVRSREADPNSWAKIQNNLGAALSQQGIWRGGEKGIRLLGEAVEVFRGLLEVCTREADPLAWAETQANLSCSLAQQGTLMTDGNALAHLNEAVETGRAAAQVYTQEEHPLDWARAHGNIGAILNKQSHRLEGDAGLACVETATAALQLALEVYTREDLPIQWAGVQRNLSVTFLRKAVLKGSRDGLGAISKAVSACRGALQVFTRTGHPLDWAAMQFNLGAALLHRGEWTAGAEGLASLEEAVSAFESAKEIYIREAHPTHWADVHRCLGHVYESMGDLDSGHAKDHYRKALQEVGHALEVPPFEQRLDWFEDARSVRERLTSKLMIPIKHPKNP